MSDIKWETPAERRYRPKGIGPWFERLAPLKERPNEWAQFGHHLPGTSAYLRKTHVGFEFVCRTMDGEGQKAPEGRYWLYARYLNGEAPE